jgi:hypothetical protein
LTDVNGRGYTLVPAQNIIRRNFFFTDNNSVWPIDHDDGSQQYIDYNNFLIYGGFKAYLGHSKRVTNSLYVYPDLHVSPNGYDSPYCGHAWSQQVNSSGYDEYWEGNTCILSKGHVYLWENCDASNIYDPPVPITNNNTFMVPPGVKLTMTCKKRKIELSEWSADTGLDAGSQVLPAPSIQSIVEMGAKLLDW